MASVEANKLDIPDLLEIYQKLSSVPDITPASSKSCQAIASCVAKEIGKFVGLPEVEISSFDGNSFNCTLSNSATSMTKPASKSAARLRGAVGLSSSLLNGEEGLRERNSKLEELQESGVISNISTGTNGNIVVRVVLADFAAEKATPNPLITNASISSEKGSAERIW